MEIALFYGESQDRVQILAIHEILKAYGVVKTKKPPIKVLTKLENNRLIDLYYRKIDQCPVELYCNGGDAPDPVLRILMPCKCLFLSNDIEKSGPCLRIYSI